MSDARPFITVPGSLWLRDPVLNGCSEDAIAMFHIIAESSDRDWRIEVSPENHAFSVRQCIRDPKRFRRWSEERINRCLAELRARGCLGFATANDREWLEVPDRLTYCKGHRPERALAPPVQEELRTAPAEPTLFSLPAPHIGMRVDGEQKESSRTPREAPASDDHDNEALDIRKTAELETAAKEAGCNITREIENWKRRCRKEGWSEDERGWRTWLRRAIERKPMSKPVTAGSARAEGMPEGWEAFVRAQYPGRAASSTWKTARSMPDVLNLFDEWKRAVA